MSTAIALPVATPAKSQDDLMNIDEFAAYIRVTKRMVHKMYYEGKGPDRIEISNKNHLWRRSVVDDWLDSMTVKHHSLAAGVSEASA